MCLDIAKALASEGKYEVGLIDAGAGGAADGAIADSDPRVCPAHWAIPPGYGWSLSKVGGDTECQPASGRNLERLHDLTAEFDFSIVHCPPASWLTARIAREL